MEPVSTRCLNRLVELLLVHNSKWLQQIKISIKRQSDLLRNKKTIDSFSITHTIAYSIIAVQELNLAYFYPRVFWNTACLIVDSGGLEDQTDVFDDDDDEDEGETAKTKPKKALDYGKISTAINKMKQFGVLVSPPDVNKSSFTFKPEVETNTIFYGLKGISRINSDYVTQIIENRPYSSFEDFLAKNKSTKLQVINLIKSGAFDELEKDRIKLMRDYISSIAGWKKKLTLQNMPSLIKYHVIPEEYQEQEKVYNFYKYLKSNCKSGTNFILDDYSQNFFNSHFDIDLVEFDDCGHCLIDQKVMEKLYKKEIEKIRPLLADSSTLEKLNNALIKEQWDKYCSGSVETWEMDSVGFYNKAHELEYFDFGNYPIVNYFNLPEEPTVERSFTSKEGKQISMYHLNAIAGTVIGKNKLKNTVTILTVDGVVNVKIYKSQFAKYDRQKAEKDEETGKKKILEKSWFTRGNKLIFIGIRKGDVWIPKKYKSSPYDAPIILIKNLNFDNGEYEVIEGRE